MGQVAFIYPENALRKFDTLQRIERTKREDNTITDTKEYLGDLSFDYKITGSKKLRPLRVYNDGVKTIIEMPKAMLNDEAPSLLIVRKSDGWLFKREQTVMANYRISGTRYIVDTVFDHAILIAGVGNMQQKVTIKRNNARGKNGICFSAKLSISSDCDVFV